MFSLRFFALKKFILTSGSGSQLPVLALLILALGHTPAQAQTYVDRTLSVAPAASAHSGNGPGVFIMGAPAQAAPVASTTPSAAPAVPAINQRSASYSSEAMGPGIVAKNADYATSFRVSVPVPPGASINNVSWRYGVASKPAGFEAVLCWQDQNSCWNVTRNAAGSTRFFNGKDAARGFTLYYRVKGSGPLPGPVNGEMNQVIVTYDLPG